MRLIFPLLREQLDLAREDKVNVLVIENQAYFIHFLTELYRGLKKYDCEIVLSSDGCPIDISKKLELLNVFVPFDTNTRTLITRLYKEAERLATGEDMFEITQQVIQNNLRYVGDIAQRLPFPLDYSPDFDIMELLKASNLRFDSHYDSLAEHVIDYMEIVNSLETEKCFVLLNFRNYVDDESIDDFYKTVLYKKLKVLIVSANDYAPSEYEKKTIIDKDLCVI